MNDEALIEKFETQASITNYNVLTEDEIQRGLLILRQTEKSLHELDQTISLMTHERDAKRTRLARLKVALAPHKRLPAEILSEVFLLCLSYYAQGSLLSMGTQLSTQWILGQVCSWWRHVACNEPRLWPTMEVEVFKGDATSLRRLCDILPQAASISLIYHGYVSNGQAIKTALVPYLTRIQQLDLQLDITEYDELWRDMTPDAFSALRAATFVVMATSNSRRPATKHWKKRWTGAEPFKYAANLSRLTLVSPGTYSTTFLTLSIPWSQLSFLDISGLDVLELETTFSLIIKCTSLRELIFKAPYTFRETAFQVLAGIDTIPPTSVVIRDTVPKAFLAIECLWNGLTSLDLSSVSFQNAFEFHAVLKKCYRLLSLRCQVPSPVAAELQTVTRDLSLTKLKSLELNPVRHGWIFKALLVPELVSLHISSCTRRLDLSSIELMIKSSGCAISSFQFLGFLAADREHPYGLYDLLATLSTATDVHIGDLPFSDDILNAFTAGTLLPQLRDFHYWPASAWAFVELVEKRIEAELRLGHVSNGQVRLRQVLGDKPYTYDAYLEWTMTEVKSRLQLLERTYGVKSRFHNWRPI